MNRERELVDVVAGVEFDNGQEEIGFGEGGARTIEQHADHDKQVDMDGSDRRRETSDSKFTTTKANESRKVSDGEGCIERRGKSLKTANKNRAEMVCIESLSPERETYIRMGKLP